MQRIFQPAQVIAIESETADAYSLVLSPPEPAWLDYLPGQYLTFRVKVGGESLRRAFSLSSAPGVDDFLRVTIKRIRGGKVSNFLFETLAPGSMVEVMPPMGNFTPDPQAPGPRHYVLVGAGSGITPLFSILRAALYREADSRVTLWYGSQNESSIIFGKALQTLCDTFGERLHVRHFLSRPSDAWKGFTGRLDEKTIYRLVSDLFMVDEYRKSYFICGPQGLMDATEAALDRHAVNPAHIRREFYQAPAPEESPDLAPDTAPSASGKALTELGAQVQVKGKVRQLMVKPGITLLQAAIEADLDPPYACRSGICTTCRAFLLRGAVRMDETEGLSRKELEEGYILTCQAHPVDAEVLFEFR